MALSNFQRTIVDDAGNVIPNATVTVRVNDSSGALASLFTDRAGTTAASNPISADGEGFVRFYVAGGRYYIKAAGASSEIEWEDYLIGTMQGQDSGAVAVTGGSINDTTVGATTPNTGAFTTLAASGNSTIGGTLGVTGAITATGGVTGAVTSSSATITGGSINGTTVGATTASTGNFTNLAYTGTLTGGTGVVNLGSGQVVKDAAGSVGIGTSSPSFSFGIGIEIANSTRANLKVNAAGNATELYMDSTSMYIDVLTSGNFIIRMGESPSERMRITSDGVVQPGADNTQALGSGSRRWSEVFAGNGTINTSDAREKTEVRQLAADEIAAAKDLSREIGAFKFLHAVELKGEDARTHIGMTVQRAIEIMEAHNLNPLQYGFICHDEWDEVTVKHPAVEAVEGQDAWTETIEHEAELDENGEVIKQAWTETIEHEAVKAVEAQDAWTETTLQAGDRYGFRLDQLMLFIARGFEARLSALEAD